MRRTALAAVVLSLVFAASANATPLVAASFQTACARDGGVGVVQAVEARGASVFRLVLDPDNVQAALPCIQQVYAAGIRVYLSPEYRYDSTPDQVADYFRQVLAVYAPYLWAVSVGNEPDLFKPWLGGSTSWSGPGDCKHAVARAASTVPAYTTYRIVMRHVRKRVRDRLLVRHYRRRVRVWRHVWRSRSIRTRVPVVHPAVVRTAVLLKSCDRTSIATNINYRAAWDTVEPIIAQMAPQAIRVYGDVSPWGEPLIKQGFANGNPPGVQAIAFHGYDEGQMGGLWSIPEFSAWAATRGLPLWSSEMAPAFQSHSFMVQDTQATWDAAVASVESQSPNLRMVSYYDWPGL
jgi:hypothetical protein